MSASNDDFMVFSGTANLPLAEKVAAYLGKPLNQINIPHFPDGETFCQVIDGDRGSCLKKSGLALTELLSVFIFGVEITRTSRADRSIMTMRSI